VLVNNAGVYKFQPLEEITEDEFYREFNINVLGTILATKEAVATPANALMWVEEGRTETESIPMISGLALAVATGTGIGGHRPTADRAAAATKRIASLRIFLSLVSERHGEEDVGSRAIDGFAKHCGRVLVREWGRFQAREELFPSNRHHPLLRQGAECIGYRFHTANRATMGVDIGQRTARASAAKFARSGAR
jgi:NAD(P)-dependent dehydrogenase (short-subunit alcohol dehydrogenase family)